MRRLQNLYAALKATGYPVAFHHFDTNAPPSSTPYICYLTAGNDSILADDTMYHIKIPVRIELYSQKPDFAAQSAVEEQLQGLGLIYSKDEIWIEKEKMYMTIYETELI